MRLGSRGDASPTAARSMEGTLHRRAPQAVHEARSELAPDEIAAVHRDVEPVPQRRITATQETAVAAVAVAASPVARHEASAATWASRWARTGAP